MDNSGILFISTDTDIGQCHQENMKTSHIFQSPSFELLHKKPIWIFMGENTAS